MSIAIDSRVIAHGSMMDLKSDSILGGGRRNDGRHEEDEEEEEVFSSSSSTSSIGRNSDDEDDRSSESEEHEVQSSYKSPLEMMESLEEVLPMRKGISKFYNGKSKSFTSLSEASSTPSIKDIAKAENGYSKKRRNIMATNLLWDKNGRSLFSHKSNNGGISKRPISSSKSLLALAVVMSSSELSNSSSASEDSGSSPTKCSPPRLLRPPLHPQTRGSYNNFPNSPPRRSLSGWRSYSVADLPMAVKSNDDDDN